MSNVKSPLKLLKVLYLEDDYLTQRVVSDALRPKVNKLFIGSDGHSGLELFNKHRPDIIITDVHMPKMSGLELIREIRKFDLYIPIIVTSGVIDTETLLASIDYKIDKYIVKPFTHTEIIVVLEMISKKIISEKYFEKCQLVSEFSEEYKSYLTSNIRNAFSNHLKLISGKGATKTIIDIIDKNIFITLYDSFTPIEIRYSSSLYDVTVVESMRRGYYMHIKSELETIIFDASGLSVNLDDISINVKCKTEVFRFTPKNLKPYL